MDDIKVDEAAQTLFEQPTNFNDNPDGKEKEKADGKGGYEPDKPAEAEEGKKAEEAAKTRQEKIKELSEFLGIPIEKDEDIDVVKKRYSEFDVLNSSLSDIRGKYEELEKQFSLDTRVDVTEFLSDEDYKVARIMKENPDLDRGLVYRLIHTDLTKLSDLDVLVLKEKLSYTGDGVEDYVYDKYNVVEDGDELEELSESEKRANNSRKFQRAKDAESARKELSGLLNKYKGIKEDLSERQLAARTEMQNKLTANKQAWESYLQTGYNKDIEKISFGDGEDKIEITLPDSFKIKEASTVIDKFANIDFKGKEELVRNVQMNYLFDNFKEVVGEYIKNQLKKKGQEAFIKYHNISGLVEKKAEGKTEYFADDAWKGKI